MDFRRLELVHYLGGSRMLRMGSLRLVLHLWCFRLNWVWFVERVCQLGCMLLRRRMCLLPPFVPFVLLL